MGTDLYASDWRAVPASPWDTRGRPPAWRGYFPRKYFPGGGAWQCYTWPTADPEGPLLTPLTKLAELVASSPTFRERCGLDRDDADAYEKLLDGAHDSVRRIYFPMCDLREASMDPLVTITWGPEWSGNIDSGGSRHRLKFSGRLWMAIHDKDRYPLSIETSARDFTTFVGNFMADIAYNFGYDDELTGDRIMQASIGPDDDGGPKLAPIEDGGDPFWSVFYWIHWS